jgi:hypothetical protein
MANLTKDVATAGLDTSKAFTAPHIAGDLVAGEALEPCSPCYIKASDGKAYQSNGTAANEAAKFDGFTGKAYKIGQAVTLFGVGFRGRYSAGTLVPGTDLFIGTVAGSLADAATAGGVRAIARAVTSTDIRCTKNSDQA